MTQDDMIKQALNISGSSTTFVEDTDEAWLQVKAFIEAERVNVMNEFHTPMNTKLNQTYTDSFTKDGKQVSIIPANVIHIELQQWSAFFFLTVDGHKVAADQMTGEFVAPDSMIWRSTILLDWEMLPPVFTESIINRAAFTFCSAFEMETTNLQVLQAAKDKADRALRSFTTNMTNVRIGGGV